MSSDVVETVSIRLVSDASELLDGIESAISDVEDAGDRAGRAFVESMSEEMKIAGNNVRKIADEMSVSFEEAAKALSDRDLFAAFSADQLVEFANALETMTDDFKETGEEAGIALAEGFDTSAAIAGENVRLIADEMVMTFEEAAQAMGDVGLFERFSEEQLVAFAEALEEMGVPLGDVQDAFNKSSREMETFNSIMSDAGVVARTAAPSFEEVVDALSPQKFLDIANAIREVADAMTVTFDEAAAAMIEAGETGEATGEQVEAVGEALNVMGELAEPTVEKLTQLKDVLTELGEKSLPEHEAAVAAALKGFIRFEKVNEEIVERVDEVIEAVTEQNELFDLTEGQVRKVVEAFREMGIEIPNALQRERIRAYIKKIDQLKDEFSDVEKEANQFTDALIEQQKKMGGLSGAISNITGGFDIFGVSIGQLVSGLGVAAVALILVKNAVGAIISQIKESIEVALSFAEAYRDLALAIRVNSVAGEENNRTFKDWQVTAQAVSDLANTSLRIGMETVTVALRELGAGTDLTDDQLNDLILTGARFSELYGIDLPAGINKASRFITEGLADSLRGLGLELDKTAQNQKAFELGLGTNIDKLDESTQEFVRYMLVLDQMRDRVDAAGEGFETLTDRMEKFEQRQEIAKKTLGNFFLPFVEGFEKLKAGLSEFFTAFLGLILLQIADWGATVIARVISIVAAFEVLKDNLDEGIGPALEAAAKTMAEAFDEAKLQLMQEAAKKLTGSMEEYEQSAGAAGDTTDDLGDSIGNLADQIDKFIEESIKFDTAMAKIGRKLADSLANIETQFQARRANAEADFQRDLRDIDQDAALDRLDAIREYQIDEIRLREDHSKDIKQLEERFLLDLEDAVRDRDARRVLQLQRRFNLEKKRREEDFGLRNKRLKEDFQIELQEIARQRLIRRQERVLSFQEEMLDLAVQQTAREEAARMRAQRAERELLEAIKSRLLLVAAANEGLAAVNQELLDNLVNALIENFGPDGPWVMWHQEAVKTVQGAAGGIADADHQIIRELAKTEARIRNHLLFMQAAAAQAAQIGARTTSAFQAGGGGGVFEMRQRGGTFFATSPTMVSAGEGRPERVDITPLSAATGRPSAGFRGGGGQDKMQIDLRVEASEQLVVEVADQTMSEVADVFVTISQRGFQGGRGA